MGKEWIVLVDDENGDERVLLQPTEDKKLARALASTINDLFPYVNAKAVKW